MAKKGRPFTYQSEDNRPVTISLRIPKELHTRLARYCTQHRQSLSELVKDGIEMRLETDADPRSRSAGSGSDSPQEPGEYYGNTEDSTALLDGASLLREMQEGFAQLRAMVHALERPAIPDILNSYYGNTVQQAAAIRAEEQAATTAQPPTAPTATADTATVAAKHHLGTLCSRGHDHEGTGHSLRNADNQCLKCNAERKAAKDARKHQAKHGLAQAGME